MKRVTPRCQPSETALAPGDPLHGTASGLCKGRKAVPPPRGVLLVVCLSASVLACVAALSTLPEPKVAALDPAQEMRRFEGSLAHSHSPISVVGCGHSGTTLLTAIIGSHPHIMGIFPDEPMVFRESTSQCRAVHARLTRRALAAGKRRWVEHSPAEVRELDTVLRGCQSNTTRRPGGPLSFVGWNQRQIDAALQMEPRPGDGQDNLVVAVVRDGRDVVHSLLGRGYSLGSAAGRWKHDIRALLPFLNHRRVYVVRYEDLVTRPTETLLALFTWLGEEYTPDVMHYHERGLRTHSGFRALIAMLFEHSSAPDRSDHVARRSWQVGQPIYDGRGGYKQLSPDTIAGLNTELGDLLLQFGYEIE
eukprot:TRINITY_DN3016_c0_g1_i1.p1 TRINITY_DN3016_c0_g1~~TRINITY_DN3016_c0_g1_i1.p1  ORF type:complete len:362 (+),score=39.59 TRINITY_DN3016_c0_g1_i1:3-1088(+)